MGTFARIYDVVCTIPKGRVLTYKEVAKRAGLRDPRIVGFALHSNKNPKHIPCHRVVKSDGSLAKGYAFGGETKQKELLKTEGIVLVNSHIDLARYLFT